MKKIVALFLFALAMLPISGAEAARVRVKVKRPGHSTVVRVHTGFPIHRTLPEVVVRAPRVTVRVGPRVFLPVVAFAAVAVTLPTAEHRVWHDSATLEREDGWTDFTLNVDRRGSGLLLEIDRGAAQISFAEVVFENGETQVVDFDDHARATGTYSLLDFRDGRKVDHVRVVARADTPRSDIAVHLLR